ncbi:unnamed protein product [Brassicogethes aeneus]|uniref:Glucose-methanol-choline oxidoreductase N-terminal domain-containing protein n=1 Tax=Brassicogethes aeneus TaxID=1431903 RepID=A0A9P0BEQ6_BRAAE|nr:unnamed protein product [Brassicogethes aeneus]
MCALLKLCVFFTIFGKIYLENNIEYLENVMIENQNAFTKYQLPLYNEELVKITSNKIIEYGNFDFIIVGAGTAGSALSKKLSKIKKWHILLLEAGGDETSFSDIPGASLYLYNSRMNWGYYTTPQSTACLGMIKRQCNYPRGKVMGGSSTINGLVYTRGNREDYDDWVKMGNLGWGQNEVLPYFMELEKWQTYGDLRYHGFNGDLNCNITLPDSNKFPYIHRALYERNLHEVDYNGNSQLGFSRSVTNVDFNKRVSLAKAYLRNTTGNLCISKGSIVTKLILEDAVARGVYFVKNNATYRAFARKEVILSAGSINTPQILMLSGIGPRGELQKHGIKVVKNLPVGRNLQDHAGLVGVYIGTNITEPSPNLTESLQMYVKGSKPLTEALPSETIAFVQVKKKNNTIPDIELLIQPTTPFGGVNSFAFNTDTKLNKFFEKSSRENAIGVYVVLLHPQSKGAVTLKSKYPKDFPNVHLNMLSDKNNADIHTLYLGLKYLEDLLQTSPMRRINATLIKPDTICTEHEMSSQSYWYCVIRQMTLSIYHPVGTTRMGKDPKTSVVASDLKVHGVKKLRVVDAGVIPKTISGHTNGPTAMIGLKIADKILSEYK